MLGILALLIFARNLEAAVTDTPEFDGTYSARSSSYADNNQTVNINVRFAKTAETIPSTLDNAPAPSDVSEGEFTLTDLSAIVIHAFKFGSATYEFKHGSGDDTVTVRVDAAKL